MIYITCKTVDKSDSFVLLEDTMGEAISWCKRMRDLGCEPMHLRDSSDDQYKRSDWIDAQIKHLEEEVEYWNSR